MKAGNDFLDKANEGSRIENIDFSGLNQKLKNHLGIDPQMIIRAVKEYGGELFVEMASSEKLDAGLFGKVLNSFTIEGIGKATRDKSELRLPFDFQYEHKGGGSNGISIGIARYMFATGEWVYKPIYE